ncbi:MAG: hypothetical protein IKH04_12075, partial [Kiritimatiellae bacterium]|nr:hypothetical protein [Kiritimatiellia bacterium]
GVLLQWLGPGGNVWTKVSPASAEEEPRGADGSVSVLVRGVARGAVPGPVPGAAAPEAAFAMTVRLALAPGADTFYAEIVSVENAGTAPLAFKGLYIAPSPAGPDPRPLDVVPNLWGAPARAGWLLPNGGAWGAVSHDEAASFRFWVRPSDGTLHPDARFSAGREPVALAPGATWRPDRSMGARIGPIHPSAKALP